MKSRQEERVLTAIQNDLLKELLKCKCELLTTMRVATKKANFHAMRYKKRECYEKLLSTKKAYNILKTFLEVCAHEEIDCP